MSIVKQVNMKLQCIIIYSKATGLLYSQSFIKQILLILECDGAPVKCENIKVVAHLSNMKTSTPNMKKQQR